MSSYFPLQSECVSIRGLAPPKNSQDGDTVWKNDQTISLRELAAWRTNSDAEKVFEQDFPNSVRELVTPSGNPQNPPFKSQGWENWLEDHQRGSSLDVGGLGSRSKLRNIIEYAVQNDIPFRAVGSGHSHSDAAAPEKMYTDMKGFSGKLKQKWLKTSKEYWKSKEVDPDHLVRVGAGTVLKRLNRDILPKDDLALPNMGSFDGQTVAGAVNTSTHGTGLSLKTFADLVRSVEIISVPESRYQDNVPYVRHLRIEPTNGITDPKAFARDAHKHGMGLIQNSELFHSVVVGYGCMGIACAYTLKVEDAYWLKEDTELMTWDTLKQKLSPSGNETKAEAVRDYVTKGKTRHFQVLVNIAAEQVPDNKIKNDSHEGPHNPVCMVRRHYKTAKKEKPEDWHRVDLVDDRWPPERRKKTAQDIGKAFSNKVHPLKPNRARAKQLHNNFFHPAANREPFVRKRDETASYIALRRLRDRKNFPPEPPTMATSTEVAVPLEHLVDAIDEVRKIVQNVKQTHKVNPPLKKKQDREYDVFYGVPMGLRFTDKSEHFLSAEYGRPSAMVEVPFPVYDNGVKANLRPREPNLSQKQLREEVAEPALKEIESPLVKKFDGRPHLGKVNHVGVNSNSSHLRPQNMFPEYEKWLEAYKYLDNFDIFGGSFSRSMAK